MKPVIAITTGDPFGVGPEVCLKAVRHPDVLSCSRPLLIGDRSHLLKTAGLLAGETGSDPSAWPEVGRAGISEWGSKQGDGIEVSPWAEGPAFHDMADLAGATPPAVPSAQGGRSSIMYIKQAVALARANAAAAIVTAPISKTAMGLAGRNYPGQTELLADLCGVEPLDVAMMFVTEDLKVALVSTHVGIRDAITGLSSRRVEERLHLVRSEHIRWFGSDPRIALCALNPHAGEAGRFGREEIEILTPAVESAQRKGVRVTGPWSADTLFRRAAKGEFDMVLALYHDQATIAVKSRSFGRAVNMTLGLPMLRTSVDHGTAYDIAGRGVADPSSMVEAIRLATRLVTRQSR